MSKQIILASASPRRKELLDKFVKNLIVDFVPIDETVPEDMPPEEAVQMLSLKKARIVAEKYDDGIIIGSDTIVVLDNMMLGKPRDNDEAFLMLCQLKGKEHKVISGLAVIDVKTGRFEVSYETTKVKMGNLSEDMIRRYIATGETKDKAGSYAIQGYGAVLVEKIEGDYFNVVGLPLYLLNIMLERFGVCII
ncbi:MAG: Maf family protein [Bacillota bacterium]